MTNPQFTCETTGPEAEPLSIRIALDEQLDNFQKSNESP
jgi:hypothetical protein